jgi:hypothetical protein
VAIAARDGGQGQGEGQVRAPVTDDGGLPWATLTAACAVLVLGSAAWRAR